MDSKRITIFKGYNGFVAETESEMENLPGDAFLQSVRDLRLTKKTYLIGATKDELIKTLTQYLKEVL